jgi:DNA-binding response OmpR family regulator
MPGATAAPKPRALVIEDEEPIRELLRLHRAGGFDLEEIADGRVVLSRAREDRFDLIRSR